MKKHSRANMQVYIVYMGKVQSENSVSPHHHIGVIQQILDNSNAEESLVRSYGRSFNGFAAKLTVSESEKVKKLQGVVNVFPSTKFKLHTTRSWDFMKFPVSANKNKNKNEESDVIIGVLDSGIWPESLSFSDDGIGPPPKKWKGVCKGGKNFTCNNKIIGARSYVDRDARDYDGHGSHTASIAAGTKVEGVSFYGLGQGSARGGAPNARIAIYKVCNQFDCSGEDILAAFDDAIADGVDVIAISIGKEESQIIEDTISIASFHAMENGILTVQSAGNDGNYSITLNSNAPWIFTVAASSMDRRVIDKVVLGNGEILRGDAVNSFSLSGGMYPLVYGQAISKCKEPEGTRRCNLECMDPKLIKGKIIICDDPMGHIICHIAGALGAIASTPVQDDSLVVPFPSLVLQSSEYKSVNSYLNTTKTPMGTILKSEEVNDTSAPVVVWFSSRGPSKYVTDVLKPDITAPGLNILAAYSPRASPSGGKDDDKRSVMYNLLSGTSMACPHVAGVAAYVKSVHPDWSPSAIKSALMTTAQPMNPTKNPDSEFAYGSGHLNPSAAINPGLVYNATRDNYTTFLCKIGYNETQVRQISGNKTSTCSPTKLRDSSPKDVNYPSMAARVSNGGKYFGIKFPRTVTNVGTANSSCTAKIEAGSRVKIRVEPGSLSFGSVNERKSFTVSVVGEGVTIGSVVSASLVWSDGFHSVRSPIVVYG